MAVLEFPQENSEPAALAEYQRHTAECLECDPGRSLHCHIGRILHNRWASICVEQREEGR